MYLHRYAHHLYQYFEPVHENSKNMLTSPMVLNLGVSVAKLARKQVCQSVSCLLVSRFEFAAPFPGPMYEHVSMACTELRLWYDLPQTHSQIFRVM